VDGFTTSDALIRSGDLTPSAESRAELERAFQKLIDRVFKQWATARRPS
jgi:hypothetical protein